MIRTLSRRMVDKIWGVEHLPCNFGSAAGRRIGEIWFDVPAELSELLVKFIFTSERLSVQAHPNDAQARAMGYGETGKSECWVIVDADPEASIAVGFRDDLDDDELRSAALDGSIVDRLEWHRVSRGDAFFIPAGTVHAIGAGISLIEVQQNNDVTFRLYDYGRPRTLHLDDGLKIAATNAYSPSLVTRINGDRGVLAEGPHFRLSYTKAGGDPHSLSGDAAIVLPFARTIMVEGVELAVGDCALLTQSDSIAIEGSGIALIAEATR